MDLHSSNTYIGILNQDKQRIFKKRVPNDLNLIVQTMEPFRKHLEGIVIESTFNWYWLVDGLMDGGYKVHLANPARMQMYKGIKHQDDKRSAFWLAELLALKVLPEGYIYPKEDRPIRDLTRKRGYFVRQRTSNKLSLQSLIERNTGQHLSGNEIDALQINDLHTLLKRDLLLQPVLHIITPSSTLTSSSVRLKKRSSLWRDCSNRLTYCSPLREWEKSSRSPLCTRWVI